MKLSIALVYIQMAEIDTVDLSHIASYVVKLDCTLSEIPIYLLDIFHHHTTIFNLVANLTTLC